VTDWDDQLTKDVAQIASMRRPTSIKRFRKLSLSPPTLVPRSAQASDAGG
jgi:hypothetical protein